MKKLYLFSPIWGKKYASRYVHYTLPSILNQDCSAVIERDFNTVFLIYSDEPTKTFLIDQIARDKTLNKLSFVFDTELIPMQSRHDSKYQVMDTAAMHALRYSANAQALFLWVFPDLIYSSNSIKSLLSKYKKGHKVVFTPYGFRCHFNLLRKELKKLAGDETIKDYLNTGVAPKNLVRCALNSMDEDSARYFADEYDAYRFPAHILFRMTNNCIVYKGFSLVATLFDAGNLLIPNLGKNIRRLTSLESSDFLDLLVDKSEVGVIESSNDYFAAAMESCLPSRVYEQTIRGLYEEKSRPKSLNYYLISLFCSTPNLSRLNCDLFQKNIVYEADGPESVIDKDSLDKLNLANKKINYWLDFNRRHPIVTHCMYYLFERNRYVGWLFLSSWKAKRKTARRLIHKLLISSAST